MAEHHMDAEVSLKQRIIDLYEQYDQSFYLFDMGELSRRSKWIRETLPNRVGLLYSAKANPNLHLIRSIANNFEGVEVASPGEIAAARLAGVEGSRIVYVGPMKTASDLTLAYKAGVRVVVVESIDQLQAIMDLGLKDFRIALRVNPNLKIKSSTIKMGGQASQFGIDIDALSGFHEFFARNPALRLAGYHIYVGTQIETDEVTLSVVEEVSRIYRNTPEKLRTDIDFISFGGGFSFPLDHSPATYPLQKLADQIENVVSSIPDRVQLFFELGRFVVAPIGYFCTRVQTIKHSKGKNFAICDSGMNGFSGHSSQSRFKRQNYPVMHIENPFHETNAISSFDGDVVGPLCTPADSLANGLALPNLAEGDILAFKNCGAYGLTHAMTMFLSHSAPFELGIDLEQSSHYVLRQNSQVFDSLCAQGADKDEINKLLRLPC